MLQPYYTYDIKVFIIFGLSIFELTCYDRLYGLYSTANILAGYWPFTTSAIYWSHIWFKRPSTSLHSNYFTKKFTIILNSMSIGTARIFSRSVLPTKFLNSDLTEIKQLLTEMNIVETVFHFQIVVSKHQDIVLLHQGPQNWIIGPQNWKEKNVN